MTRIAAALFAWDAVEARSDPERFFWFVTTLRTALDRSTGGETWTGSE